MKSVVILNEDDLREVVEYFITKDKFVFDVEAQGVNRNVPHLANVSWISLATDGMAVTIPFGHPIGNKIIGERPEVRYYKTGAKAGQAYKTPQMVPIYEDPPQQMSAGIVFEILRRLFWRKNIIKVGHNLIYDLTAVSKYFGDIPPPPYSDTIIKQWLLDENMLRKDLKTLAVKYFGADYDKENVGKRVESFPFDTVSYYTYCDAIYTYLIDNHLDPQIDEQNLRPVFDLEMDVLHALVRMQLHGAKIDVPKLYELKDILDVKVVDAESAVYKAAGHKFNVNSNPQKQHVLYVEQGLKPWKLTKGGQKKEKLGQKLTINDYSTDADVLASYDNPVTKALTDYQEVSKLLNTYVIGWLGDGHEKETIIFNDHIHADFVQYGTVTGRFSCREPNLQNIPRPYTELGQLLRGVFIPECGGKLVVADYAQIELVVLAHYLEQGKLFEAFQMGIDPHTMTAAMVLGKDPSDVTKVERQDLGKTLGFAVVYGAGIKKVANMAKVSVQEAKRVLATHKKMFPEIHAFKEEVIRITKSRQPDPYLTTLSGRKRRVSGLFSADEGIRMGAERQAFNSLIQGGAADLIKMAMIRLDETLPPEVHLTMTVHDELILASPENMAEEAAVLLKEAMTGKEIQALVKVPLMAEVKIVDRWNEAK